MAPGRIVVSDVGQGGNFGGLLKSSGGGSVVEGVRREVRVRTRYPLGETGRPFWESSAKEHPRGLSPLPPVRPVADDSPLGQGLATAGSSPPRSRLHQDDAVDRVRPPFDDVI